MRRRLVGAEGGDAGLQGLRIGALEYRNDLVVALAFVELLGQSLDDFVVGAGHRVPPLDLGGRLRRRRQGRDHRGAERKSDRLTGHYLGSLGMTLNSRRGNAEVPGGYQSLATDR